MIEIHAVVAENVSVGGWWNVRGVELEIKREDNFVGSAEHFKHRW
ncbi:MAG: hypothetical protein ACTSUE_21015 [Promethearchaeota archaeon]